MDMTNETIRRCDIAQVAKEIKKEKHPENTGSRIKTLGPFGEQSPARPALPW